MSSLSPKLREQLATQLREAAVDKVKFAKLFFRYDLSPKQQAAVNMPGRVRVKNAGRRFGKSSTSNIEVVHKCITKPNATTYVIGPSIDQALIYFDEIEKVIKNSILLENYIDGEIVHRPFPMLKFKNGSVIHGRSTAYDGRYIRGKGADLVAVTEAAFIKDEVFQKPIRALTLDNQGDIIVESTPNGHNYFYNLFQRGLDANQNYYSAFHATVFDNPRLSEDDIKVIRQEIPDIAFRIEYLAEFVDDDTFVFSWEVLQNVMEDYTPSGIVEPNHVYAIGVDLAKLRDYTVITVLDCGLNGQAEQFKIVEWVRLQQVGYHEVIIPTINNLQAKYDAFVYLDATGVGVAIEEEINRVQPMSFTQKTREDLISRLVVAVEQRKILLPSSNRILRDELRYFQRQQHGQSIRAEAAQGFHDDSVFSLALAIWGAVDGNLYYGVREFYRRLREGKNSKSEVIRIERDSTKAAESEADVSPVEA